MEPDWMELQRKREENMRENYPKARELKIKLSNYIEAESGIHFGEDLHIGMSLDLDSIRFDIWFQTDGEFEENRQSGSDSTLTEICEIAAQNFANAKSTVYFHSHQFVKEKCGGNYYTYLR